MDIKVDKFSSLLSLIQKLRLILTKQIYFNPIQAGPFRGSQKLRLPSPVPM